MKKTILWQVILMTALVPWAYAQSTDLDKRLGAENAALVETQMGIYDLEVLSKYVKDVGDRLVAQLEDPVFDFQFNVVDEGIPNAFALPGGYVYVTRGLLSLVTSEDELAGVIGHEIIHVTERHAIKRMKKSIFPSLLELPGNIVGVVVNDDLGKLLNVPISTSNALLLSSYGRKQETQSDKLGAELASKAGYDPLALITILERITKAAEIITNEKEKKSYFDSHPYTPDRVKNINKSSGDLDWTASTKVTEDFPTPLQGMIFGTNPAEGVFQENKFLHPDLGFAITFPEGWETTNQPAAVGAVHPDRTGAIFLGLDDPNKSPTALGTEFKNDLLQKYPSTKLQTRPYEVNGNIGYLATITDQSGRQKMYIHILWVKMGKNMFKIIGLAPYLNEGTLKISVESIHTITKEERQSVKQMVFQVVTAKESETMEAMGKRTNSNTKAEANAFVNGVTLDEELEAGKKYKLIKVTDY